MKKIMQLTAYEVREDEKEVFKKIARAQKIKIVYSPEMLCKKTLRLSKKSQAITISGRSTIDKKLLLQIKELGIHCIATRTIGYEHIDLKSAKSLGIQVANSNYGPDGVADYTVMLMLMALRKFKQAYFRANVNDYTLNGLQGKELKNLTVGIVGTGHIGTRVAEDLSGFGCKIIATSYSENRALKGKVTYVSLADLYKEADIITFHIPITAETHYMVNKESLSIMKKGVVLVNCSRGELMNVVDVIEAVENEKIGALALDVFENENGIYHKDRRTDIISNRHMAYLRQFPNVIMTQHLAFYTEEAVYSMVARSINDLILFTKGERCENEITH